MNAFDLQQQGLPGGSIIGKGIATDFSFKTMTGDIEFLLQDMPFDNSTRPNMVSSILAKVLDNIGEQEASLEQVRSLSIGDRDYLLVALAAMLNDDPLWLTAECAECDALMDLSFRFADLPAKRITSDFVTHKIIPVSFGDIIVRIPDGRDHEAIADIQSDDLAASTLLQRLVNYTVEKKKVDIHTFNEHDLHLIEVEIESMSPEMASEMHVECPDCSKENRVSIDVLALLQQSHRDIFSEVHQLASNYHWSEKEIFSLPTARRKRYLHLIESMAVKNKDIEVQ